MTRVFIVNGKPRAGKDGLIGFMQEHLRAAGVPTVAFSSIDPVRDLLSGAGFDVSAKTEADRKLLADVGSAVEEHSNWRTNRCIDEIVDFYCGAGQNGVFFLHMREPKNIETMRAWIMDKGLKQAITMTTIKLRSYRAEGISSNTADASVDQMVYDYTLSNDWTLDYLRDVAKLFLKEIGVL